MYVIRMTLDLGLVTALLRLQRANPRIVPHQTNLAPLQTHPNQRTKARKTRTLRLYWTTISVIVSEKRRRLGMRTLLVAAVLSTLCLTGCDNMETQIDRDAEIEAVARAVHNSIEWCFPDKDRDRLYAHCAKDSTFFMFQPSSRSTIDGFDAFQQFAERIFFDDRFTPISTDIKDLTIHLSEHGDVAWFSCLLDDVGEWDGQPIGWFNCRWTGVLQKRDGIWLLCQQHFSLPTDADEA
ncbi:hypothetical protein GF377_05145 [candidate division GN15 bacterium]|nr:hypothetical protein [candidate division GN15 bacterium]